MQIKVRLLLALTETVKLKVDFSLRNVPVTFFPTFYVYLVSWFV